MADTNRPGGSSSKRKSSAQTDNTSNKRTKPQALQMNIEASGSSLKPPAASADEPNDAKNPNDARWAEMTAAAKTKLLNDQKLKAVFPQFGVRAANRNISTQNWGEVAGYFGYRNTKKFGEGYNFVTPILEKYRKMHTVSARRTPQCHFEKNSATGL
jgi:hypothetical protein